LQKDGGQPEGGRSGEPGEPKAFSSIVAMFLGSLTSKFVQESKAYFSIVIRFAHPDRSTLVKPSHQEKALSPIVVRLVQLDRSKLVKPLH